MVPEGRRGARGFVVVTEDRHGARLSSSWCQIVVIMLDCCCCCCCSPRKKSTLKKKSPKAKTTLINIITTSEKIYSLNSFFSKF